jgi:hypothetical protein
MVKNVINQSKIKWALGTFIQFKSVGIDEFAPALKQQGVKHLVPCLCCTFRACLAYGFIPMAWRQVRETFIPIPGKSDYTKAKAYRPISLSSFLWKMMEKFNIISNSDCPLRRSKGLSRSFSIYFCPLPTTSPPSMSFLLSVPLPRLTSSRSGLPLFLVP